MKNRDVLDAFVILAEHGYTDLDADGLSGREGLFIKQLLAVFEVVKAEYTKIFTEYAEKASDGAIIVSSIGLGVLRAGFVDAYREYLEVERLDKFQLLSLTDFDGLELPLVFYWRDPTVVALEALTNG